MRKYQSISRQVQMGFTLIELVVVIVILGILAATALPKFINVSTSARVASLNGLQGALLAADQTVHSAFLIASPAASPVAVEGGSVVVWGGYPDASAGGIGVAANIGTQYTATYGTAATSGSTATFSIQTSCTATYTAATATTTTATATVIPSVTLTTSGC